MITAVLRRTKTGDTGTFGSLEVDGQTFVTGELPDRDNAPDLSSVPAGTYLCRWSESPRFGHVYQLQDVPGRSHVLIHSGNHCGDTAKGLKSDVEGCILLGSSKGLVGGQEAVVASRDALERFTALMAQQDFELTIVDEYKEAGDPMSSVV